VSWESINEMIGLAMVDLDFRQELLAYPLEAAQARGFKLTPKEQEVLKNIAASDIYEFSQLVQARLGPRSG